MTAPSTQERMLTLIQQDEPASPSPAPAPAPEAVPAPEPEPETLEVPESEPQAEPSDEPTFTVHLSDGETKEVSAKELTESYRLRVIHDKKLAKVNEQQRALEQKATELADLEMKRTTYLQKLEAADAFLAQASPKDEDLTALKQSDPTGYAVALAEKAERERERQKIAAEHERTRVESLTQRITTEQRKLEDALPEWRDPEVKGKEQTALVDYARRMGFSAAELDVIGTDHRSILVLRKAMLHDQAKTPRPVSSTPKSPTLRPGSTAAPKVPVSKRVAAQQRLAKSGSMSDARSAFLAMLDESGG